MGEWLIIYVNILNIKIRFVCICGGNVLGINGSVIYVFKKYIEEKGKVGIIDFEMICFFLIFEDVIKFVFKVIFESMGGEIFVMKMFICKIVDFVYVLIEVFNKWNVEIEIFGIRLGEKIYEFFFLEYESIIIVVYDDEYFVILLLIYIDGLKEFYFKFNLVNLVNYNLSKDLMSRDEIKEML